MVSIKFNQNNSAFNYEMFPKKKMLKKSSQHKPPISVLTPPENNCAHICWNLISFRLIELMVVLGKRLCEIFKMPYMEYMYIMGSIDRHAVLLCVMCQEGNWTDKCSQLTFNLDTSCWVARHWSECIDKMCVKVENGSESDEWKQKNPLCDNNHNNNNRNSLQFGKKYVFSTKSLFCFVAK